MVLSDKAHPPPTGRDGSAHVLQSYLRRLIVAKRSTLCVSADVMDANQMLALARAVGPSIVVFKTHADILRGWDAHPIRGTAAQLSAIAREQRFLIFEDRKFADIGFTCQLQYAGGVHRILEWAHIVNSHIISGPDAVRALVETAKEWTKGRRYAPDRIDTSTDGSAIEEPPQERAILLLAQMSSAGNFLDTKYTQNCVDIAQQFADTVMGFIAMGKITEEKPSQSASESDFLVMTPGCSLHPDVSLDKSEFIPSADNDALGQQYRTPREVILGGSDLIIVGTGICNAKDPLAKAEQYRQEAWDAYQERLALDSLSFPLQS